MKTLVRHIATAVALLLVTGVIRAADKDLDAIQGNWKISSLKFAPPLDQMEPQFATQYEKVRFEIKGDVITAVRDGKPTGESARLQVDSRPKPKTVHLLMKDATGVEKTVKGVYALEGDKLRICFGFEARPRKLHDKPTEESFIVVLEHVKPVKKP